MALTNAAGDTIADQEHRTTTKSSSTALVTVPDTDAIDPILLTISIGRKLVMVEMEIMGQKLTNTIVDSGSRVKVLPEETWRGLGKPTL